MALQLVNGKIMLIVLLIELMLLIAHLHYLIISTLIYIKITLTIHQDFPVMCDTKLILYDAY